MRFDELPGEEFEMDYIGASVYQYNWDTTKVPNGVYNARLFAQISSGETVFADPISISVYNYQTFNFQILEPIERENQKDQIFVLVEVEPQPEYVQMEVKQNNLLIEKFFLSPPESDTIFYSTTWTPPTGLEGELNLEFTAVRSGFENARGQREIIYIKSDQIVPIVASSTEQILHFYIQSPLPQATINASTTIKFVSNLSLDYLNLIIEGPVQSEILLDTSLSTYDYDWDLTNYPDGDYVLQTEARSGLQTQITKLEIKILNKAIETETTGLNSDIEYNDNSELVDLEENYYVKFQTSEVIVSGTKKFIIDTNIPSRDLRVILSGPHNEILPVIYGSREEEIFFWWRVADYSEGKYQLTVEIEYEDQVYRDFIKVEYQKENFDIPILETDIDPYELYYKNIPTAPVSGVVAFELISNYYLDKVQIEINNKKYDTKRLDEYRYGFQWDTNSLSDGKYILTAGGILSAKVKSNAEFSVIVKNQKTELLLEEQNKIVKKILDPTDLLQEEREAKNISLSASTTADNKALLNSECLAVNIQQKIVCEQYLKLEPECRVAGKTTLIECRQFLSLDSSCRDLNLNSYQCRIFLQLPRECQSEKILTEAKCHQFIYRKALPPECYAQNILTQKECDDFISQKNTIASLDSATPENKVNQECLEAGLNEEECQVLLQEKYLAKECFDAGINDLIKCDQFLLSKYSKPECEKAGIDDKEECQSYLVNKFVSLVQCDELSPAECRQFIRERYLGELIDKDRMINVFETKILSIKDSLSVTKLRQVDEEIARAIPLKASQRKVRVLRAQRGRVIDKNNILQQSASVVLVFDEDGDGLIDSVEKRLGTNPKLKDTDKDGYSDGDEVRNGFNPLGEGKLSSGILFPIDEALLNQQLLEHPKTNGKVNSDLQIEQIENVLNEKDNFEMAYVISGQAEANSVLTVYVYSDLPVVATVKSDEFGNWQYELSDLLSEGEHEVYVAVNDNTGKILKKSNPISFFIKEAKAVSINDFVAISVATPQTEAESMINIYVVVAVIIVVVSLLLFFILFVILKNKQA